MHTKATLEETAIHEPAGHVDNEHAHRWMFLLASADEYGLTTVRLLPKAIGSAAIAAILIGLQGGGFPTWFFWICSFPSQFGQQLVPNWGDLRLAWLKCNVCKTYLPYIEILLFLLLLALVHACIESGSYIHCIAQAS